MHIKKITFQNYRAFKDVTAVTLKPLTLVFGQNNSGKSSAVRLLPSITNSCTKNPRLAFQPVTLSDWPLGGLDFIYGKGSSSRLQLGFIFETEDGKVVDVKYETFFIEERAKSVISRLTFLNEENIQSDFEWNADINTGDANGEATYTALHLSSDSSRIEVNLGFDGLLPTIFVDAKIPKADQDLFSNLRHALLHLKEQMHWLGPLRHTPERIERRLFESNRMGPSGKETSQILANSYKHKTGLFEHVSTWFEVALKHRLVFIEGAFDAESLFSLALSPLNDPAIRIPIADTGTGIAQVLPVILLCELASTGELGQCPILVLENPELHLHDSAHDDLGRLFSKVIRSEFKPTLVVETHSENILLAIQIALAETGDDRLTPSEVTVNWVRRMDVGSSTIENVDFDVDGVPIGPWPTEAFMTAPSQAKKLFNLRAQRSTEA